MSGLLNSGAGLTCILSICLAVLLLAYWNVLSAPFIFDDTANIVRNPDIKTETSLRSLFPYSGYLIPYRSNPARPLTYWTFHLNYALGGLNPYGYHLFNVLLHALNALLVFLLARKLCGAFDSPVSSAAPPLAALLFALHPIQTEVVSYISHRAEALNAFFYLAALLAWIRSSAENDRRHLWALPLFVLALASKETGASLPPILLLYDFIFVSRFDPGQLWKRKARHLGFWAILAAYVGMRYVWFRDIGDPVQETSQNWTRYSYFKVQLSVVFEYIRIFFVPVGQTIDHAVKPVDVWFTRRLLKLSALVCAYLWVLFRLRRRNPPLFSLFLFAGLWFAWVLAPTSSVFPINDAMTERRMYLPSIAFCLTFPVFILGAPKMFSNRTAALWAGRVSIAIFAAGLATLFYLTRKRNELYQKPEKLWEESLHLYPKNSRAWNNLGELYHKRKKYGKALELFLKAVETNPRNVEAVCNTGAAYKELFEFQKAQQFYLQAVDLSPEYPVPYYNLGTLYMEQNDFPKAEALYLQALERNPYFAEAIINLGNLYLVQKKYDAALNTFQAALNLAYYMPETFVNLGKVYRLRRDADNARIFFEKALKQDPANAEAHRNLGEMAYDQNDYPRALRHYDKALRSNPALDDVLGNMGNIYYDSGDYDRALRFYQKVIALKPARAIAYYNAGNSCFQKKDFAAAEGYYKRAVEANPGLAVAHNDLGVTYGILKKPDLALQSLQTALEIGPPSAATYKNIAQIHYEKGEYQKAAGHLERAVSLDPRYVEAWSGLAQIYESLGEVKKARESYIKLSGLVPGNAELVRKIEELGKRLGAKE